MRMVLSWKFRTPSGQIYSHFPVLSPACFIASRLFVPEYSMFLFAHTVSMVPRAISIPVCAELYAFTMFVMIVAGSALNVVVTVSPVRREARPRTLSESVVFPRSYFGILFETNHPYISIPSGNKSEKHHTLMMSLFVTPV